MRLLVLALLIFLTACAEPERVVITVREPELVTVPEAMLDQCPALPVSPKGEEILESQVSEYLIRLHSTASQCRAVVEAVRDFQHRASPPPR